METTTNSRLVVQQWDDEFFEEYVRANRFNRYMGESENNVIMVREDLTKKKGDRVTLPWVGRADASTATTGNGILEGAEQELDQDGFAIPVDVQRTGFVTTEWEEQKSAIDLRGAFRSVLKNWAMERMRGGTGASSKFGIIDNMYAIFDGNNNTGTYVLYGDATETQKDAWLVNNADRALFGATISNAVSNDHSTSLGNVDNTTDKLTAAGVSLAKRIAKTADPHIRPLKVDEEEEWFVMFSSSQAFRDLKSDATITAANREAWQRYSGSPRSGGDGTNPLFRDSDLVYDGVIIREVPEIQVVSNGSINCSANFLCGAGALGNVWAKRTTTRELNGGKGTDYGFRQGVAIMEIRGTRKLYYQNKQHGMVTYWTAAVADT